MYLNMKTILEILIGNGKNCFACFFYKMRLSEVIFNHCEMDLN